MSDIAIRVENLSKRYFIGSQGAQEKLASVLFNTVTSPVRRTMKMLRGERKSALDLGQEFWALKDISFELKKGEVLGVIGRNGAGKSTLLKILSGITLPTSGYAETYGQVGSLLEVGTGFHPDLTGRENVYLNGSILGIPRAEITRQFDEIVDFSGIEKFIDTPVKFYSSGMYVRLAFAVAAQLQPDILIVDEVLAVGDAAFQKKALGKVSSITHSDRTVLFVSHNINAIVSICTQGILLGNGQVIAYGETAEVASLYQLQDYGDKPSADKSCVDLTQVERYGTGKATFTYIEVTPLNNENVPQPILHTGENLRVNLKILAHEELPDSIVAVIIYDRTGYRLIDVNSALKGNFLTLKQGQAAEVNFHLSNLLLKPEEYTIGLWLGSINMENTDGITYAASFKVEPNFQEIKYSSVFPGPYQCHFSHEIALGNV